MPSVRSGDDADPETTDDILSSLLSISKSTRALIGIYLADLDLSVGQDQLLSALESDIAQPVGVVSDKLNVRPSTISKMVDRLIEKSLVKKSVCENDARRTTLMLTEEGLRKRDEVRTLWSRLNQELGASGMTEIETTARCLREVDSMLMRRLSRLR